jgi:hypothetical protein
MAGLRSGIWVTQVVNLIVEVRAAMAARPVHASCHIPLGLPQLQKWSGTAATSNPNASSRTKRSRYSDHGTFGITST